MKIVIVMTYYNRLMQLERTLASIMRSKIKNFEIVIVDDKSDEAVDFSIYGKNIHTIRIGEEKFWVNPVIPYNIGIHKAITFNPSIIILQNAECYHYGDIMYCAARRVRSDNYLSFSCLSLDPERTYQGITDKMILDLGIIKNRPEEDSTNWLGWFNHPEYNPHAYDFCAAISVENIRKINGYDERYAKYIWYGDNDLIMRIRRLGLKIVMPRYPFVVHQYHERKHITPENSVDRGADFFNSVYYNETGYKAVHTYTPDL